MSKSKTKHYLLFILLGCLFGLGWPPYSIIIFLFVGLSPIIYHLNKNQSILFDFILIYLFAIAWNLTVLIWLPQTRLLAGSLTIILNSFIISIPFVVYRLFTSTNRSLASIALLFTWISIEQLHQTWQLSFPFLNLGNSLAEFPQLIQWYSITGSSGGSYLILIANLLVYEIYASSKRSIPAIVLSMILAIPFISSLISFYSEDKSEKKTRVTVVQTKLDAWTEKYIWEQAQVVDYYLQLIQESNANDIDYLVLPETALPDGGWYEDRFDNLFLEKFRKLTDYNPKLKVLIGAIVYEVFQDFDNIDTQRDKLRYIEESGLYFYTYNGVFQLEKNLKTSFRSKEALVPFEEFTPYPTLFEPLAKWIGTLGEFNFSTKKNQPLIFENDNEEIAYLICYEMLFPELFRSAVGQGAEIIFSGANEGWYKNKIAANQMLHYASIRAIESGRYICKSSNYGISAIIDNKGRLITYTPTFEKGTLSEFVRPIKTKTFFMLFGDVLGNISKIGIIFIILLLLILKGTKNKPQTS